MMTPQEKRDQFRSIVEGIDKLIADGVQDGFQRTVSIGGVYFTYASLADLLKLRDKYVGELAAAEAEINHVKGRYRLPIFMP